jgi:hypothetical protein
MSDQATAPTEEHWIDDLDELPARPRRRLLTPLTGGLLAVLVAVCGFIGGVLVEKGQSSSSPGGNFAAAAARLGGAAGAGGARQGTSGGAAGAPGGLFAGGQPGNVTAGQVSSVEGRTLYVTTPQGNTVRVKVPNGESVSRSVTTSVHAIHPGDSVVIQGSRGSSGRITASSVRATQASSSGSGSGSSALGQLFGGGGTGGGSTSSGAGKGGAVNGLFGP